MKSINTQHILRYYYNKAQKGEGMRRLYFLSFIVLGLNLVLWSCSDQYDQQSINNFDSEGAAFLLEDEIDPLAIETDQAFMIDGHGPMYFRALDLTEEQKDQMHEIARSFRDEFHSMHQQWHNDRTSWEEIRAARDALRQQMYDLFVEILTEEQKAVLEEIEEQLANGQYPTIIIQKRVESLTKKLGLTPEQQAKISDLFAVYGALLLSARNESENRQVYHETRRAILSELNEKILDVLDDAQEALYQEMKKEHLRSRRFHRGHRG
jgi:Spy/CpxP family protein refolding chaperone